MPSKSQMAFALRVVSAGVLSSLRVYVKMYALRPPACVGMKHLPLSHVPRQTVFLSNTRRDERVSSYSIIQHTSGENLHFYPLTLLPKKKVGKSQKKNSRLRINLIQKPATILPRKHARKPPRLLLQRLHILNLHHEHVPRLRALNVKGSREVVDLGEVHVAHVVCAVVVADLAAGPVNAFDLDNFAGRDAREGGVVRVPAVLRRGVSIER
jgi:hypothetical protein